MTIEVDYRFPPGINAEKQAMSIAIGQTAGTWDARFTHREKFFRSHLAEVININTQSDGYSQVTITFPLGNTEGDIPSLLTMIFGKYSMAGSGKIMAVRLPENYGLKPKFGIRGIREYLGVFDPAGGPKNRPLIMAIFKPALGLSPDDYATIIKEVGEAGIDLVKDDEIMPNLAEAPTLERWRKCRQVLAEIKEKTGKNVMYAVNITGNYKSGTTPLIMAKRLVEEGANALLFNVLTYGFSMLEAIASDPEINVPIFAHPALAGALCAAPDHGLAYSVILGTLMAHAGADAVLYPAHYGSLPFDPAEENKIKIALRSRSVFPVPSAGIRPEIVPQIIADYGQDVILNAGTGIMDAPGGPAAGVKAFQVMLDTNLN